MWTPVDLWTRTSVLLVVLSCLVGGEQLLNGGFESMNNWSCGGFKCELVAPGDSRFGSHSVKVSGRTQSYQGPSQHVNLKPGTYYKVQSYVKLLNQLSSAIGHNFMLEIAVSHSGGQTDYITGALRNLVTVADGWVLMQGDFLTPNKAISSANFYYQGPEGGVEFLVDQASMVEVNVNADNWRQTTDAVINRIRKSDINFHVTTASGIAPHDVRIEVKQTKKSFPFGSAISSWKYVDSAQQKYRDWIHTHLNWGVLENGLKWDFLEPTQGNLQYDRAVNALKGLTSHGIKVRGHNLVWSVDSAVPTYVRGQTGNQLRDTVRKHIQWTCQLTRGLVQHWDVNNENLHGYWFQRQLHDINYNLELFRETHAADPNVHLFLNDYNVVGGGDSTGAYLAQARKFKAANVNLYGLGVQSHFPAETEPSPTMIKSRLDTLAQAGLPIWATELTVEVADEHKRADYYERALRALYGHEAVEGILFWGFWDQSHYLGEKAALVRGNNLDLTEAGRRVLDLLENQWMTHESHTLSTANQQFAVRGFHGDYQISVFYQNHELTALRQTFSLGKTAHPVTINVHK
ncbi:uncharacterized protein LOC112570466 [Pomacea canaliculata]|uniref:uncharacterized protein LOC112570466 n=1 Tax=Pomacea canaliculata TaxID=400727 RepID=UPI000D73B260|nr:uncharacterized protein LOC112570466 [Pomacea canaliculata]